MNELIKTTQLPSIEELIEVIQLPVIKEQLKILSSEIDQKVSEATSLVCNEETVKTVKAVRAELTKEFNALEKQRKAVKTAIMAPYEQLEKVYKECVSFKYEKADITLKMHIDEVENQLKEDKRKEVKAYFNEYAQSKHIDFVTYDTLRINVTLSASMKSLKEQVKSIIDRIASDLTLINTQEHKEEILVEYKQSLDVSRSITMVTERHKAIEEQKARQVELEAKKKAEAEAVEKVEAVAPSPTPAPLAPPKVEPTVEDDPMATLPFPNGVTARMSKLRELKRFLDEGEYMYE